MIVEERDFRVKVGKLGAFLAHYEQHGLPVQIEYLASPLGYFTTEIGELNHVVSWWGYASVDERSPQERRDGAGPALAELPRGNGRDGRRRVDRAAG